MHPIWDFFIHRWVDITWAAVFGLIFAIIVDLLSIGSRIRSMARGVKNRLSERSSAKIRARIRVLEMQRSRYLSYTTSDKALYLYTFRLLMGVLAFISFGALFQALGHMHPQANYAGVADEFHDLMMLVSIFAFIVAMALTSEGARVTSWDTRDKIMAEVAKLDKEIENLESKLGSPKH